VVKRYLTKKLKNPLFFNLLAGCAAFAILIIPVLAQANTFSFITTLLSGNILVTSAHSASLNSQTMPLLAAAVNLDPSAAVGGGDISVVNGSALVPDQSPAASDTGSQHQNSQISVYTVRNGDTLSGIAAMFDVTTNTIIGANNIKNGVIHPGETLIILPITGMQHIVAKGDTLLSLAKNFRSDAHDIASYNSLSDGAALTVGQTLIIPNGETTAVVSGSTKSSPSAKTTPTSSHVKIIAKIAKGSTTEPYLGGSGPSLGGYFAWPVDGGIVTQALHGWNGVDVGASKGTAIYASAGGTVLIAKSGGGWNGGYGNYVVIAHDNGTQTLYAHMSQVLISQGSTVGQGDAIGKVGATGMATGNHLHFEVRGAVNPFSSLAVGSSN
jgi:LysM repeat protein